MRLKCLIDLFDKYIFKVNCRVKLAPYSSPMTTIKTFQIRKPIIESKDVLPAVLTIAGSDSSGGAGIEADLKTFSAHGVYGLTCITALTAQNTQKVQLFEATPKELVKSILDLNFQDFLYGYDQPPLKAIKTGMLTPESIGVLQDYLPELEKYGVKIILDPVMISTSGSSLLTEAAMKLCIQTLIKNAFLITPNFQEAQAILSIATDSHSDVPIASTNDFINFVKSLQKALGCKNVLVKGGHIPWDKKNDAPYEMSAENDYSNVVVLDVLYEAEINEITIFESAYINTQDSHGTGCTLASSIAANVAKGLDLSAAIPLSVDYIHRGMLSMGKKLGHGNGPLNHITIPETSVSKVITLQEDGVKQAVIDSAPSFYEYLKNHPRIKDNWKLYSEHRFIKHLANNTLPFDRFLYFLKQDYYYLINYAQVHALAASVAPTYKQTHSEALVISNIVEEIEKHKQKLCDKYDIDYEKDRGLDIELNPGPACINYCNYLLKMGRNENYFAIKMALAPCLHGYYEAGVYGSKCRSKWEGSLGKLETKHESDTYQSWLDDYTSDWFFKAHQDGQKALEELFEITPLSQQRLDELVDIFNEVTLLEVRFWDEVLDY